jgi:ABC-type spermidine/putrescine transport system permease subunit I
LDAVTRELSEVTARIENVARSIGGTSYGSDIQIISDDRRKLIFKWGFASGAAVVLILVILVVVLIYQHKGG